ncbi:Iwr1 domain-containing protein [Haematococcus lacustris]|uniref:Iwr1 domain-containing protein n=1 Tax=Haematococcus lacustris TaxID=44745 RepID=A0A6A0A3R8_HAELA|nr:Iwr1 domain-containing protein [Haematococcus lacustris]
MAGVTFWGLLTPEPCICATCAVLTAGVAMGIAVIGVNYWVTTRELMKLKAEVANLKTECKELKTDIKDMKSNFKELKTEFKELRKDVKQDTAEMKRDIEVLMSAPGERLQLLRVKRRRCDAVAETFVVQLVHAFGPLTKRMRPDQLLLHQIESNLHLEENADSESLDVASANPEHQAAPSEHSLQVCRNAGRRFVRIATLTQEALQSCSAAKLKQLISDVAAVKPPRPAAKRSDTGSHLMPSGVAATTAGAVSATAGVALPADMLTSNQVAEADRLSQSGLLQAAATGRLARPQHVPAAAALSTASVTLPSPPPTPTPGQPPSLDAVTSHSSATTVATGPTSRAWPRIRRVVRPGGAGPTPSPAAAPPPHSSTAQHPIQGPGTVPTLRYLQVRPRPALPCGPQAPLDSLAAGQVRAETCACPSQAWVPSPSALQDHTAPDQAGDPLLDTALFRLIDVIASSTQAGGEAGGAMRMAGASAPGHGKGSGAGVGEAAVVQRDASLMRPSGQQQAQPAEERERREHSVYLDMTHQQECASISPGGMAAEDDLSLDSDEAYVFDMYVAMEEDGVAAGSQEGAADCPVIEVADSDDEFYWTWREAGGGSKLGSEHDSEDSNAESFYANSYPDEDADWDEDASGEDSGTHRWTCCADDEEFDADAYDSGAEAKLEGKSQQEKTRAAARSAEFPEGCIRQGCIGKGVRAHRGHGDHSCAQDAKEGRAARPACGGAAAMAGAGPGAEAVQRSNGEAGSSSQERQLLADQATTNSITNVLVGSVLEKKYAYCRGCRLYRVHRT